MIKKCKMCNKEFKALHLNEKYCSQECREKAHKEQIDNWKKSHPEYAKKYMKKWHSKHPGYNNKYSNLAKKTFNKEFVSLIKSSNYSLNDIPEVYRNREKETPGYICCISDMYVNANFTCEISGKQGNAVHHLNAYHWDVDNRCNYNNMIVLHNAIHRFFHFLYGYQNNTKEQFDEFLNLHFCLSIDDVLNNRGNEIWS